MPHRGQKFAPESWPIRRGSNSQQQVLKPIRGQIHEAARKLRSATSLGLPLVVVRTDPHKALSGLLWPRELIAAVQGDMTIHYRSSRAAARQDGSGGFVDGGHDVKGPGQSIHIVDGHLSYFEMESRRYPIGLLTTC